MNDSNEKMVDGMVDSSEKMLSTKVEDVLGRFKEAFNVSSDAKLAQKLNIYPQNISAWRVKKSLPFKWYHIVAEMTGYSFEWLRFGRGLKQKYIVGAHEEPEEWKVHDDQQSLPLDETEPAEKNFSLGRAVEKVARIYQSKLTDIIQALNYGLDVFIETIESKNREKKAADDSAQCLEQIANLTNRLLSLENEIKERGPVIVERRSGIERRQKDDGPPPSGERRSGHDRRRS